MVATIESEPIRTQSQSVFTPETLQQRLNDLGNGGKLRRFTVPEYYRLAKLGIFQPGERTELLNGMIIRVAPGTPHHAYSVSRLSGQFWSQFDKHTKGLVRTRSPISLEAYDSELLPDLAVVAYQADGYSHRHPSANETFLVVEVADTTLEFDQTEKLLLYLWAEIPEYWIVNLLDRLLEVYQTPYLTSHGKVSFKTKRTHAPDQGLLTPLAFPDCQIDLSQVFPK